MPESRVVVQSIFIHAFDKIQNTKLLQVYDARFRANVLECLLALGTAAGHVLLEGLRLGDVGLLGLGVVGVEGGGGGVTGVSLGGCPRRRERRRRPGRAGQTCGGRWPRPVRAGAWSEKQPWETCWQCSCRTEVDLIRACGAWLGEADQHQRYPLPQVEKGGRMNITTAFSRSPEGKQHIAQGAEAPAHPQQSESAMGSAGWPRHHPRGSREISRIRERLSGRSGIHNHPPQSSRPRNHRDDAAAARPT